jgi:hypothetical protein
MVETGAIRLGDPAAIGMEESIFAVLLDPD